MVLPINEVTQPITIWQSVWPNDPGVRGEWKQEGGGLQNDAVIASAVILCLFTDVRARDDDRLPHDDDDRRGWWGDYVDVQGELYERPLGSRIWLYERSIVNEEIARAIRDEAEDSLLVLIEQGLAASIEVTHEWAGGESGWVKLFVNVYSREGQVRYSQIFSRYWNQVQPGAR